MKSDDVAYADGQARDVDEQMFTAQIFNITKSLSMGGLPSGTPVRLPATDEEMPNWPPLVLFDVVYASAVVQNFGKFPDGVLEAWEESHYNGPVMTAGKKKF